MTYVLPLVALGGALGASLRYLASLLWPAPWGVMAINVFGSFAIGTLAVPLLLSERGPHPLAPLIITGVLGGFTTFSAFSLDTLGLISAGRVGTAMLYVGGSVGLSLLACGLGLWIGRLA
ncbi:CrcB-like protein [Rubellimicrobium mesophilum DSM 19309]|uniref:Fluoride-specific ion channel FluC n=1 Tax=Rubellimicrobium mesophilum DSM 19309 TaxID=442562 RepID=A0A017HR05_9RHOB|nr:CrcB family protein [Rubellimicrobium mesophilum]EYD76816.1 CrcB-like protein [Rubellimicrobium mesophilum DSM 19309]